MSSTSRSYTSTSIGPPQSLREREAADAPTHDDHPKLGHRYRTALSLSGKPLSRRVTSERGFRTSVDADQELGERLEDVLGQLGQQPHALDRRDHEFGRAVGVGDRPAQRGHQCRPPARLEPCHHRRDGRVATSPQVQFDGDGEQLRPFDHHPVQRSEMSPQPDARRLRVGREELPDRVLGHGLHQLLLRRDVVVQRRVVDTDVVSHLAKPQALEPRDGHPAVRRSDKLLAPRTLPTNHLVEIRLRIPAVDCASAVRGDEPRTAG